MKKYYHQENVYKNCLYDSLYHSSLTLIYTRDECSVISKMSQMKQEYLLLFRNATHTFDFSVEQILSNSL